MVEESKKQILIVEDFEALARALRTLLELSGFEVHTEGSGHSALSYAAEHHPDLVILDLGLPDINGYQVCRALRKQYHASVVPVVMLTARDQPVDQLRGFGHGADAYLTKPCEPEELLKAVSRLLGREEASEESADGSAFPDD